MSVVLAPELIWTDGGFQSSLELGIGADGGVEQLGPLRGGQTTDLPGIALLPGFVNNHSHAFQRALRGRGQRFPKGVGSFWTWRQAMYDLVEEMTAAQLRRLTVQAFTEMRRAGFTRVAEFHYLHHDAPGDFAFDQVVVDAAAEAGIGLRLLVVAYQTSDCDGSPPGAAQRRFATPDLGRLWERVDALASDGVDVGVVAHSIRAVPPDAIAELWAGARARGLQMHMHVEEQPREITACRAAFGGRSPMGVLLDVLDGLGEAGDASFTAVHCTHSDADELGEFLRRGGRVCVCPTTEADLGDGIPNGAVLAAHAGQVSVGTDSNARISALEELRWLEYGQRLARQARGAWVDAAGELGATLLSVGLDGPIEAGAPADLVEIDLGHPALADVPADGLAEALVLGCPDDVVAATWVAGRRQLARP